MISAKLRKKLLLIQFFFFLSLFKGWLVACEIFISDGL